MNASLSRWDTRVIGAFVRTARGASGAPVPPPAAVPNPLALREAEHWLRQGVPIVVPTETVYGLAARAGDRRGVERVFSIKGRPADNPLIAHISSTEQLSALAASFTPLAERLARQFWPGPLTLVLHTAEPRAWLSAGLDSIAVRMPRHPFMHALIERVGPLAAPSANLSGRPSPSEAAHALADLAGQVPLVVDGGALDYGLESTVVDARGEVPVLLRPGAVSLEELEACVGSALSPASAEGAPRSPGMKYRHYSPRAALWLYPQLEPGSSEPGHPEPGNSEPAAALQCLAEGVQACQERGLRIATIASRAFDVSLSIILPEDARSVARALFGWLRQCDERAVDVILVEGIAPRGIGRAVMDRLERAAERVHRSGPGSSASGKDDGR